jgi:23S rRNA (guanosine2251-2'-O)-methyltransferase
MPLPKNLLTIYGRNALIEALENDDLSIYALHLATTNKKSNKLDKIISLAKKRDIDIKYHSREKLSFISKNKKQDQGVALDITLNSLKDINFLDNLQEYRVLALDSITNPQNLGMIIRSATAGNIDAIILQKKSTASLVSPLTIKASVGTIFKLPIIYVDSLYKTLKVLQSKNGKILTLDLNAKEDINNIDLPQKLIFVLGNETDGVSKEINALANKKIKIFMNRGVESLNVAATGTLLSFLPR